DDTNADTTRYKIYRSTYIVTKVTGLTALTDVPKAAEDYYDDTTIAVGTVYYYIVTSVDAAWNESKDKFVFACGAFADQESVVNVTDPQLGINLLEIKSGDLKQQYLFTVSTYSSTSLETAGKKVKVTLGYSTAFRDAIGADKENQLKIHKLDITKTKWEEITDSVIDVNSKLVSADVDTFSVFTVLLAREAEAAEMGTEIYAYPNPCYVSQKKEIIFTNLQEGTELKIYNAAGELVFDDYITVDTPRYTWKLLTKDGKPVASGVYIYVITKPGEPKVVNKIAIIR
ncbi:MAG: T9SS type A sorting domain-containing protein, partial [Elusimicrobiota bacterium]|nr:T9SS type A sorting domain-containing protein [Elusimicrobiota bacterium]